MGTPDFAVTTLNSLYSKGYKIDLVIKQKDKPRERGKKLQYTPVKERALELNLQVYQPESINSDESYEIIKSLKPDFIIVVAYGQILKRPILDINWVLLNGEKETGITIMEMEEGLDTGDMVLSKAIEIKENDDAISLHDKLSILGGDLIVEALEGIVDSKLTPIPQDNNRSSYASMLSKSLGKIDWNKDSQEIVNKIRALKPWPSAYSTYKDQVIKIHFAQVTDLKTKGVPGQIVTVDKEGIYVNGHERQVLIKEIQFPNKGKMPVSEYLKGNTIEVNTILT